MNELNYVYYGGKSLAEFDLYITNAGIYETPQWDYDKVSVPGRNGDLIFDNNRFMNVDHSYPAIIASNFKSNFAALKAYLFSRRGYCRLEDTFCPDEFYMAIFKGIENVHVSPDGSIGTFNLVFDRKPQRFLKSGEREYIGEVSLDYHNQTLEIKNPTRYTAYPILKMYFKGSVTFKEWISPYTTLSTVVLDMQSTLYSPAIIDCETGNAGEYNEYITATPDFPKFDPLDNYIQVKAQSTGDPEAEDYYFSIIPRWWTI